MANDCRYEMTVVGQKESVERLISIMRYQDPEWYLYRVFDVDEEPYITSNGEKYAANFSGYVAWSAARWVSPVRDEDTHQVAENGAHYTNLLNLSGILGLSIAVTTEESGMGFCEFYHIRDGELIDEEVGDYESLWFDDRDGMETVRKIVTESDMLTPEEKKSLLRKIGDIKVDEDGHCDREMIIDIGGWEHDFMPEDVDSDGPLEHVVRSCYSEMFPVNQN